MADVSLREYIEAQFAAHQREHAMGERALELAAALAAQTKQDANEWRSAMTDRERTFLSKAEYQAEHASLAARIDILTEANIARLARDQERDRAQVRLMALIGLAATVVSVGLSLLIKLG